MFENVCSMLEDLR